MGEPLTLFGGANMTQTIETLCAVPGGVNGAALEKYKQALAKFPTGVAVVTALTSAGDPIGLTVNSFVSISLEPAIVSWSLRLKSSLYEHFVEAGSFVINVLAADQSELATQFATRREDRFEGVRWSSGACGDPVLSGVAATFECEEVSSLVVGDHVVFFGGIAAFSASRREPLVMHSGKVIKSNVIHKSEKDIEALELKPVRLLERGIGGNLTF